MGTVRTKVGVYDAGIAVDAVTAAGEWILLATRVGGTGVTNDCLLYTSPSPRD